MPEFPGASISGALTGQHHSLVSRPAVAPHPMGEGGTTFPSTAATSPTLHESGWNLKIVLDREGRPEGTGEGTTWRSGEALRGHVEVVPREMEGGGRARNITSLIVRAFWTSTTLYDSHRMVEVSPTGRFGGKGGLKILTDLRAEWHRGFCENGGEGVELWDGGELEDIRREIEGDFPLLERESGVGVAGPSTSSNITTDNDETSGSQRQLPFIFHLPTHTSTRNSNASTRGPTSRTALQRFNRTPPSSLDPSICRNASVEWAVEAILRFQDSPEEEVVTIPIVDGTPAVAAPLATPAFSMSDEELPTFNSATAGPMAALTDFGLLESTSALLVERVVFTYEPYDHHAQDLYSAWRPVITGRWAEVVAKHNGIPLDEVVMDGPRGDVVPAFGRDPRDEALGGTNMGSKRAMKGKFVEREGGRNAWCTFEKRMVVQGAIGRKQGWVRTEVSIPSPARFSRHAPFLPILLNFSYISSPKLTPKALANLKAIGMEKAVIVLALRTQTRGGKEERSHFLLQELRRQEVMLFDDEDLDPSRTARGRKVLSLDPDGTGRDFLVEFDLQGEGISTAGKKLVPLRTMGLTLRTPNIEREYVLSVTMHSAKGSRTTSFFALRSPIQIVAGDIDSVPHLEGYLASPPVAPVPLIVMPEGTLGYSMETELPGYAAAGP